MTTSGSVVADGLWLLPDEKRPLFPLRLCQGRLNCTQQPSVMARFIETLSAGDRTFHLELCWECALPAADELQRLGKPISPAHNTIAAGAGRGRGGHAN